MTSEKNNIILIEAKVQSNCIILLHSCISFSFRSISKQIVSKKPNFHMGIPLSWVKKFKFAGAPLNVDKT